jgi:DedD protein
MAERRQAEDDFNPRHRIVGAVILVALAVIVLPMLLSDHPPETPTAPVAVIPTPDARVIVAPVPPPGSTPGAETRETVPATGSGSPVVTRVVPVPVGPAVEKPASSPAPVEAEKPAVKASAGPQSPKTASVATRPAAPVEKGWMVQVGAFSHLENARHLQEKLKQKGFPASLEPATPAKGKTVRVEVGPYKDAAAAKAAQARIHAELGIKGIVRSP